MRREREEGGWVVQFKDSPIMHSGTGRLSSWVQFGEQGRAEQVMWRKKRRQGFMVRGRWGSGGAQLSTIEVWSADCCLRVRERV